MGFGSYDESEQSNREVDTDFDEDGGHNPDSVGHDGDVEFEFTSTNDELLNRLKEIKDDPGA